MNQIPCDSVGMVIGVHDPNHNNSKRFDIEHLNTEWIPFGNSCNYFNSFISHSCTELQSENVRIVSTLTDVNKATSVVCV